MGKSLIIKGADFSANGIKMRTYLMASEEDIESAANVIALYAAGYAYSDQSLLRGKTLKGIRANVETAGTIRVFKATSADLMSITSQSQMTEVATLTTGTVGIQDIDFSSPITMGANDWLIFGAPDSETYDSLVMYYYAESGTYNTTKIGSASISPTEFNLAVAFYED